MLVFVRADGRSCGSRTRCSRSVGKRSFWWTPSKGATRWSAPHAACWSPARAGRSIGYAGALPQKGPPRLRALNARRKLLTPTTTRRRKNNYDRLITVMSVGRSFANDRVMWLPYAYRYGAISTSAMPLVATRLLPRVSVAVRSRTWRQARHALVDRRGALPCGVQAPRRLLQGRPSLVPLNQPFPGVRPNNPVSVSSTPPTQVTVLDNGVRVASETAFGPWSSVCGPSVRLAGRRRRSRTHQSHVAPLFPPSAGGLGRALRERALPRRVAFSRPHGLQGACVPAGRLQELAGGPGAHGFSVGRVRSAARTRSS